MVFPWRYSQFILGTHWNNYLTGHQKYHNQMVPGSHDMGNLMDGYQDDCTLHGSWIQCISEGPAFSGSPNPTCIPSPLLRRKTSSLLLPMVTLHIILPPNLVLAGLPSPGSLDNSSPIDKFLLLVVIPSSLPLINDQSSPKSPLGRLPMLFRSPNTLTPSSPTQSAHKQSEMCSSSTHSRLLQRRKSHCLLQYTGRSSWPLLSDTRSGLWRTGRG